MESLVSDIPAGDGRIVNLFCSISSRKKVKKHMEKITCKDYNEREIGGQVLERWLAESRDGWQLVRKMAG